LKTDDFDERILPYVKEHRRQCGKRRTVGLLGAGTALCVFVAMMLPGISMGGSTVSLQSSRPEVKPGESAAVAVSAAADADQKTIFLISPRDGAARLSEEYTFAGEQAQISTSSGDKVVLHECADTAGTEYWFSLDAGEKTAFSLNFASSPAADTTQSETEKNTGTAENAQSAAGSADTEKTDTAAAEDKTAAASSQTNDAGTAAPETQTSAETKCAGLDAAASSAASDSAESADTADASAERTPESVPAETEPAAAAEKTPAAKTAASTSGQTMKAAAVYASAASGSTAVLRAVSGATLEEAQTRLTDQSAGESLTLTWSESAESAAADSLLTAQSDTTTSLDPFITHVTINGNTDTAVTVVDGDSVKIAISYTVGANQLSSTQKTLTYQLPAGFSISKLQSGTVFKTGTSDAIGTYQITTDGAVTINFNETYDPTGILSGTIQVDGSASSSGGTGSKSYNIGASTLTVEPKTEATTDLNVSKTHDITTVKDGKIHYTVTAYTVKGTAGTVNITDTMTANNVSYDTDSFVVKDTDGNVVDTSKYSLSFAGDSVSILNLPQLTAGGQYTITYTATPDWSASADTGKSVNNNVTATSGGDTKTTQDYVWLDLIKKYGSYDEKTGTINWTITVNDGKTNLNGFTLSDVLTNPDGTTQQIDSVSVTPKIGGSGTIHLPYTFQSDDYNTYIITYSTAVDTSTIGAKKYANSATLTKDGQTHTAESGEINVTGTGHVTKQFVSETPVTGKDGAAYTWSATLVVPADGITTDYFYQDFLDHQSGKLLMTPDTAFVTVTGTDSAGNTRTLTENTDYDVGLYYFDGKEYTESYDSVQALKDAGGKATTFTVRFLRAIPQSEFKTITVTYGTYADYSDISVGGSRSYANTGRYGYSNTYEESTASHSHTRTATIAKQGRNQSGNYTDAPVSVDYDKAGGKLYYRLLVNTDHSASGPITITDMLPAGTTFDESSFQLKFYYNNNEYYQPDNIWIGSTQIYAKNIVHHQVSTVQNEDGTTTLTITIDDQYGSNGMAVYYAVRITDQKSGTASYVNTARMGDTSVSQTTNVTHKIVSKTAERGDGTTVPTNIVTYRVVLNPGGADLLPNADKLTLTDTMTYTAADVEDLHLVQGSVRLYKYDATADNAEGAQLDNSSVSYSYDAVKQQTTFTIPDSQAVVLQYQYYIKQTGSATTLTNTATLTGVGKGSDKNQIEVKVSESSATADQQILTIYKVDAADNASTLPDAVFRLDRWENSGWTSVGTYTTDSKGTFRLDGGTADADVKPALVLYRLVEEAAPDGFALNSSPYCFVWGPDGYTTETLTAAMAGTVTAAGADSVHYFLLNGGAAYITDTRNSIEVKKVWLAPDGTTDPNAHTGVTVQMYKNGAACGDAVTLNAGNNWANLWKGLDPSAKYTVKETVGEEGYTVSYDNNGGISYGTITVKNTGTPTVHYALPSTGGPGAVPFTAAGSAMLCVSVILILRRKRDRNERSCRRDGEMLK